jgi:mannosyl-3-phosphoglycerate phosphatase
LGIPGSSRASYREEVRKIVFSDLDGTLLDPDTYSCGPAEAGVRALRQLGHPLVLCSSKTRAELEFWRERLENNAPFIVENGGAIYIPRNYFPFPIDGARRRGSYDVIEFGTPYAELVRSLQSASVLSRCRTFGFHEMSVAQICLRTSLPVRHAEMAKKREYDEPFEILGSSAHRLLSAIRSLGKTCKQGDRFYHLTGRNDKAHAVQRLTGLYARAYGDVSVMGIGNTPSDTRFLAAVQEPVIVRSPFASAMAKLIPRSFITMSPGPAGWNEAILLMAAGPALAH